jgi:hypothetical protein
VQDHQAMGTTRGPRRSTALALVVAIGVAAVGGFLISRPQGHGDETVPVSSPGPNVDAPFSTDGYSVANDPDRHQLVVFGGDLSLNQTWLWGTHWTLARPTISPSGRENAAIAYDPDLHMVLLFGGIRPAQTYLGDTWGWNGTTWRELNVGGFNGPPPGQASMAWDTALDEMVLMPASSSGADTWTWAGTRWIDHRQPDPYLPTGVLTLAFDPETNAMVAVGFGNVISPKVGAVTQTWTWDGTVWTQLVTAHTPTAYVLLGLGWDPISARLLLFAEGAVTPVPLLRWAWTGADWTALPPVSSPRLSQGLLTSFGAGNLLLVGELSGTSGEATPIRVWAWTGNAWAFRSARD